MSTDQSVAGRIATHRAAQATTGDGGFAALACRLAGGRDVPVEEIDGILTASGRTGEDLDRAKADLLATYARTALHATLPERARLLHEAQVEHQAVEAKVAHEIALHAELRATAATRLAEAQTSVDEARAAGGGAA